MKMYTPIKNTHQCFELAHYNGFVAAEVACAALLTGVYAQSPVGYQALTEVKKETLPTNVMINRLSKNVMALSACCNAAINRGADGFERFLEVILSKNTDLPSYRKDIKCDFDATSRYFNIDDFDAINNNLNLIFLSLLRLETVTNFSGEICAGSEIQNLL